MIVKLNDYKLLGNPRNCIYKITNPSGNIYIGKTVRLNNRIGDYIHLKCENQKTLINSFIFHGISNHIIEIIEKNLLENELLDKEIYYINLFNSYKKGMNMTLGGDGQTKYSDSFCLELLKLNQEGYHLGNLKRKYKINHSTLIRLINRVGVFIKHPRIRTKEHIENHRKSYEKTFVILDECEHINGEIKKVIPIRINQKNKKLTLWETECNKLNSQLRFFISQYEKNKDYPNKIIKGKTLEEWKVYLKTIEKVNRSKPTAIIPLFALNEDNILIKVIPKKFKNYRKSDWHTQCLRSYCQLKTIKKHNEIINQTEYS